MVVHLTVAFDPSLTFLDIVGIKIGTLRGAFHVAGMYVGLRNGDFCGRRPQTKGRKDARFKITPPPLRKSPFIQRVGPQISGRRVYVYQGNRSFVSAKFHLSVASEIARAFVYYQLPATLRPRAETEKMFVVRNGQAGSRRNENKNAP